jgi:non-heme chloroperoxidase
MRILNVLRAVAIALAFGLAGCATTAVEEPKAKPKALSVKTPDGVTISAQEWGNPSGPEIVFLHGFMQSSESWSRQVNSDLAREFRMITFDFRGHGLSDKPWDPKFYNDAGRFADELKAVMDAAGLKKPVLVGWSYGSRILTDYLAKYGSANVAGINYVGAAVSGDAKNFGPGIKLLGEALKEASLAENLDATRAFLRSCFETQPSAADFETMAMFNMAVPVKVRQWLRRPAPYEPTLKAINVPTLVTHGMKDQVTLVTLGEYVASTVPNARSSYYEGVGHSPFWEDPKRFNKELAELVRSANKK